MTDHQTLPPEQPQAEVPKPDALAKVAENLSALKPKQDALLVISGENLGSVLPAKFYEGASALKLTDEEKAILLTVQDATDDEIEIRPDGLIYVEHITVRRALSKVFGAEWALLPGSPIVQDKMEKGILVCQRWVLVVRGCYVGEAIGAGSFYDNNIKQNKTDAAEAAGSEAIRRICAKTALGICSNVFQKSTARRWRREFAIEVWVKNSYGTVKQWRRKDADKFEGEINPVEQPQAPEKQPDKPRREAPKPAPVSMEEGPAPEWNDAEVVDALPPNTPEPPAPAPPPPAPERNVFATNPDKRYVGCAVCGKSAKDAIHIPGQIREATAAPPAPNPAAPTPPPTGEPMVTQGNWQLFIMECRKRGLVKGEVAEGAIAFLSNAGVKLVNGTGKKQAEVLYAMFKTLTAAKFNDVINTVRDLAMKG